MVKNVRGRAKPKWEHLVKIVLPVPKHRQKFPDIRMDRNKAKGRLYVCFSHVAALAKVLNCWAGMCNLNLLEGEIVLFNKVIDARGPRHEVG